MKDSGVQFEFYLKGKTKDGSVFTPDNVPLDVLADYAKDLRKFLIGSNKEFRTEELRISIGEGSLKIKPILGAALISILSEQIAFAAKSDFHKMDKPRAEIVKSWQSEAKTSGSKEYIIKQTNLPIPILEITKDTDLKDRSTAQWVHFEDYIVGNIVEAGGMNNVNIHVRPIGVTKTIVIDSKSNILKDQKENFIFQTKRLLVSGEVNITTGDRRNYVLLAIKDMPKYDEDKLNALINKAAKSWENIDSKRWLEELRNDHA